MTPQPDQVTFINTRLDEDEAAARKATPGPWFPDGMSVRGQPRPAAPSAGNVLVIRHTWPQEAGHIMRHDPARVLREVAAKRAILDLHDPDGYGMCRGCPNNGIGDEPSVPITDCPERRALAAVWSDHQDYPEPG